MAGVLEALGKSVLIVNGQETPPNLAFIDPEQRLKALGRRRQAAELEAVEVLMVLDTSAWAQLGHDGRRRPRDQGPQADPRPSRRRRRPGRRAVQGHRRPKRPAGWCSKRPITWAWRSRREIATPLFAAIATDTGWFRFGSTTRRHASRRRPNWSKPARRPSEIYDDALRARHARAAATARPDSGAHARPNSTAGWRTPRRCSEDFAATGALPSDTEDVINMTLAIAGTRSGGDFCRAAQRAASSSASAAARRRSIAASWPSSSAAAGTRRRPAHSISGALAGRAGQGA